MIRRNIRSLSRPRRFYSVFIVMVFCSALPVDARLLLQEDFRPTVVSQSSLLTLKGAKLMKSDVGDVLRTDRDAWAEMNVGTALSPRAGTLIMWVKPEWPSGSDSHPLVSLRWQDGRHGYLALSQGWWEPLGTNKLYFILNNQDGMTCVTKYQLYPGAWNMVVAIWGSGENGFCKLYVNGEKIVESRKSFSPGNYSPAGPLYLGSERGSTDQRQRVTKANFYNVRIFDTPLSDAEVRGLFVSETGRYKVSPVVPSWLQARIGIPYTPRRDATDTLLESRVMFDEDMHWAYSPTKADAILQRVKSAGFNVYVPCIYHGGGSRYPTTLLAPDPKLAERLKQKPDPLAYLIEKAHSMGIEVHPWFTVAFRADDFNPQFAGKGTPEGAYDVHNEAFRSFIVNLMLDVVRRYDVDGINLDYIRAMGICTSDACKADYARKTGGNLTVDMAARFVMGDARTRIQRWQEAAVKDIVAQISIKGRAIKPQLIISVDGHPVPPGMPPSLEGRNEVDWVQSGLIHVIYNMDYRRDIDVSGIEAVRKQPSVGERLAILFGNYDQREGQPKMPREGALVSAYVEYAQRKWPGNGIAYYIYESMSDDQVRALRTGPFREEARPYWPPLSR